MTTAAIPFWRLARFHFLLFVLLVLPCAIGSPSAYLALLATLMYLPVLGDREARRAIIAEPAFRLVAVGLVLLLVAFTLSARAWNDVLLVFDFIILAVAFLVFAGTREFSGRQGVLTFAIYALAGAAVAVATGLSDIALRGLVRAEGLNSNPIHFADVASALGWAACIGFFATERRWRWLFLFGPVLGLAVTMLAEVRGTVVAFPPLALVVFVCVYRTLPRHRLLALGVLALGAVALLIALLSSGRFLELGGVVSGMIGGSGTGDTSTEYRLVMWAAGWQAFLDSPIFGHGWTHYVAAAFSHVPQGDLYEALKRYRHLHNDFVDFAAAAGILGLGAYGLFIAAPVASALRGPKDGLRVARICGVGTLSLGYLIYGLTNQLFGFEMQTNLYALGAALLLALCRERPAQKLAAA